MTPRELLQALMDRDGLNPSSLSRRLHGSPSQPQIYKFLEGVSKEPKLATLQPIADLYRITVDAFYNPEISSLVAANLKHNKPLMTGVSDKQDESSTRFTPEAEKIAELFDMIPVRDKIRRAQAEVAALAAILAVVQSEPSTQSKAQHQKKLP